MAVIRPAGKKELSQVLELWRVAEAEQTVTDDEQALSDLLARDPESLLVYVADGRIAGTLIAAWDGWRGNMYRLAVHPDHRRKGIAGKLVTEGERRLRAKGCRRITALVLGHEEHATAFWTAAGYDVQPEMNRFRRTPD